MKNKLTNSHFTFYIVKQISRWCVRNHAGYSFIKHPPLSLLNGQTDFPFSNQRNEVGLVICDFFGFLLCSANRMIVWSNVKRVKCNLSKQTLPTEI